MSQHGAALQTYNQELVKCLEDLKLKRNDLLQLINKEEQEKNVLERNIACLQEKLFHVKSNLDKHKSLYNGYEKVIQETEVGFQKILESGKTLLNVARQEIENLKYSKEIPSIGNKTGESSCQYD